MTQSANELVEEARRKAQQSEELLAEQRKQAEAHLKKQLEDVRGSLTGQLTAAQKTIAELKAEIAQLLVEKTRLINEKAKAPAHPERAKTPEEDKKKTARQKKGILGDVDFDEDRPLGEQLKEALTKNAIRVLDLFREWDVNGDGEVSKKEFRDAMPKLGFELPVKVIDDLFDSQDPDGSGVMDLKELQKMLRPAPKPGGAWGTVKKGAKGVSAMKAAAGK